MTERNTYIEGTEPEGMIDVDDRPEHYAILYREDGVYVNLPEYPREEAPLSTALVAFDLNRRGVEGVSLATLSVQMRKGETSIRVAAPQQPRPVGSSAYVSVGKGAMWATMQLLPPSRGGDKTDLFGILTQLGNAGVREGIDREAVSKAVEDDRYFEIVDIAQGREPVKGKDGTLKFLFDTDLNRAPSLLDDGSVDFKNLNTFASVRKGDAVVERTPAEAGVAGFNVRGEVLEAKRGIEAKMPTGKNVELSPDGSCLIASCDGRIDYVHGQVVVSDQMSIQGDVDMGVGNVDFIGDMVIHGGVIAGLTVKATGNIEVRGSVEAATLIAGGDVILKKGMQGMDKGVIEAGGSVISSFLERCQVKAGADVMSDYITHSNVEAMGSVETKGRRGRIIGGSVKAGKTLTARTVGTASGERTFLEITSAPELRIQQLELTTKMNETKEQLDKVNGMLRVYGMAKNLEADKRLMIEKLQAGQEQLQATYDQAQQQLFDVKDQMSAHPGGKVHVLGEVFQDVKIIIDGCAYIVRDTLSFATFKLRGGEVVFTSYEAEA